MHTEQQIRKCLRICPLDTKQDIQNSRGGLPAQTTQLMAILGLSPLLSFQLLNNFFFKSIEYLHLVLQSCSTSLQNSFCTGDSVSQRGRFFRRFSGPRECLHSFLSLFLFPSNQAILRVLPSQLCFLLHIQSKMIINASFCT